MKSFLNIGLDVFSLTNRIFLSSPKKYFFSVRTEIALAPYF